MPKRLVVKGGGGGNGGSSEEWRVGVCVGNGKPRWCGGCTPWVGAEDSKGRGKTF